MCIVYYKYSVFQCSFNTVYACKQWQKSIRTKSCAYSLHTSLVVSQKIHSFKRNYTCQCIIIALKHTLPASSLIISKKVHHVINYN